MFPRFKVSIWKNCRLSTKAPGTVARTRFAVQKEIEVGGPLLEDEVAKKRTRLWRELDSPKSRLKMDGLRLARNHPNCQGCAPGGRFRVTFLLRGIATGVGRTHGHSCTQEGVCAVAMFLPFRIATGC